MSSLAVPLSPKKIAVEGGRHNRDQAGDEPPQPRPDPDVQEAFHHDLTRERPCERRVLARREQRQREYGARPGHAQERREQLVGLLDLGDRGMTGAMEGGRGDDQDRRIDEQREAQGDSRIR